MKIQDIPHSGTNMSDEPLLSGLPSLPEEENIIFASSSATFPVKDDGHNTMTRGISVFVIIICLLGFANGVDWVSPTSGLVQAHEFVYRMTHDAPPGSGIFSGEVMLANGTPAIGFEVLVNWENNSNGNSELKETTTDENGKFKFAEIDPGLAEILIRDPDTWDSVQHRILISPPPPMESVGKTWLEFTMPSEQELEASCDNCSFRIVDHTPNEMKHPMMDASAAMMYVLIGWGFIGLSALGLGFAITALRTSSVGMLRTSAIISFFTQGHYYSACLLSIVAFALTFAIQRKPLELIE